MAKKKQKIKEKGNIRVEISQMQGDVKTFIEKFKSDVAKKRKDYQASAKKLQKKKS